MPNKGRPRLTPEDLAARITEYCLRYKVTRGPNGLPPFPTGKRETQQHREWIGLYKVHNRQGRRLRGQCERCSAPASAGSVFCEEHRAENSGRAGNHGASLETRQALLAAQGGRCPICAAEVDLWDSVDHSHATGHPRAVLHARCNRLAGLAEVVGPDGLARLQAFLWPDATDKKALKRRQDCVHSPGGAHR